VGEEASGRNEGFVVQPTLSKNLNVVSLGLKMIGIWADMKDELDFDVGYRRVGSLRVARSEDQLEQLCETMKRQQDMGVSVEFLSPEDTRRMKPPIPEELEIVGAKYCPTDGHANPLLVVKAICRVARRKGVQIKEHEPVRQLKAEGDRVAAAITGRGEYYGSTFVIAAGAWSRELCNTVGLDFPAVVEKGQVLVTEALPPIVNQLIIIDDLLCRQALEGNVHLSQLSSVVRMTSFDKSAIFQDFVEMRSVLPKILPFLRNVNLIRVFTGVDDNTPDLSPILDKAPGLENLFLITGFSGYGFSLGPIVGNMIAEWIVDGRSSMELTGLRWNRFDGMPGLEEFKAGEG
jgi:sarcosine oxidase subunit beta